MDTGGNACGVAFCARPSLTPRPVSPKAIVLTAAPTSARLLFFLKLT